MYTFESRIRFSEVDVNCDLTFIGLLNYFQDCSTFQSEDLGIGVEHLFRNNMLWVVNFWQIDIFRYPHLGEKVTIGTMPYEFKGFIGFRNFFMKDEKGEYLAKAYSIWTLLELDSGKPKRPTKEHIETYGVEERLDMEYLSRKIAIPDSMVKGRPVEIRVHHLDTNRHVNNGQYVNIAIDALRDIEALNQNTDDNNELIDSLSGNDLKIKRLRVEYKKQVRLSDVLSPYIGKSEDDGNVICLKDENDETCCVIETKFFK